jgi:hypothetical protein
MMLQLRVLDFRGWRGECTFEQAKDDEDKEARSVQGEYPLVFALGL